MADVITPCGRELHFVPVQAAKPAREAGNFIQALLRNSGIPSILVGRRSGHKSKRLALLACGWFPQFGEQGAAGG